MQNIISHVAAQTNIDMKAVIKGLTGEGQEGVSFQSILTQLGGEALMDGDMLEELSTTLMAELGSMVIPTETMQQKTDMPLSEEAIQTENVSIEGANLQMSDGQALGRMTDRQPMLADLGEIRDSEPIKMTVDHQTIQQNTEVQVKSTERPLANDAMPMMTTITTKPQTIDTKPTAEEATKTLVKHTVKVENSESKEKAQAERKVKTEPFDGVVKEERSEKSNPFMRLVNHDQRNTINLQTMNKEAPKMTTEVKPQMQEAVEMKPTPKNGQAVETTTKQTMTETKEIKNEANPFKVLDKSLPLRAKVEGAEEGTQFQVANSEAPQKVATTMETVEPTKITNMQEIREAIQSAAMKGNEKLSVKLKPEVLGGLVIEAVKGQSGTKISIIAETFEGLEALKGKLPEIETVIKQGGSEFQGLDLSYSNEQGTGQKWEQHMPRIMKMAVTRALPGDMIQTMQTAPIYNAQGQLSLLA